MCNLKNRLASITFVSLLGGSIVSTPTEASPMLDFVVQQFQNQRDAVQIEFRSVDGDLGAPPESVLTLSDDVIDKINLTSDGVITTILYNDFHCTNTGYGWCSSGGCGFFLT